MSSAARIAVIAPLRIGVSRLSAAAAARESVSSIRLDSPATDASWSADGLFLAVAYVNPISDAVHIFNVVDGVVVETVPVTIFESVPSASRVSFLSFGPRRSSRFLYLACGRSIIIWDRKSGKIAYRFTGSSESITAVAMNVDETNLAVGSKSGGMVVYSLKTNTPTHLQSRLTQ
ncbi:hypothetical protein HK100_002397, partial [Physocladia obscura]